MKPSTFYRAASRPGGAPGRLRYWLAPLLAAAIGANAPVAAGETWRADVLDIQTLVVRLLPPDPADTDDIPDILALQRALDTRDEAPAPAKRAGVAQWATGPPVQCPPQDRARETVLARSLLPVSGDAGACRSAVDPPPKETGARERYRFTLLAHAPPRRGRSIV